MAHRNRWFTAFTYYKLWFSMAKLVIDGKLSLDVLKHFLTTDLFRREHRRQIQSDPALWRPLVLRIKRMRWGHPARFFGCNGKGWDGWVVGWLGGWVGMCQDCECWTILNIEATRSINPPKSQSKQCGNSHNAINNYQLGMIYTNIY